eukprot:9668712-Alexandrium_andersonii.AAC.1
MIASTAHSSLCVHTGPYMSANAPEHVHLCVLGIVLHLMWCVKTCVVRPGMELVWLDMSWLGWVSMACPKAGV